MGKLIAAILFVWATTNAVAQQAVPLDQEFKSTSGSVEMTCKVTKIGENHLYMYSIKNKGLKPIKVKWDIISQAMYFGNNIDLMLELDPDENVVFTLEHPDTPMLSHGRVTTFYLTNSENLVKMVKATPDTPKDMKIEISKKTIYNSETGDGLGILPRTFLYPNKVR